eukprot:SAG31_NODE_4560_length_3137_cov_7.770244_3_plen_428_part_00
MQQTLLETDDQANFVVDDVEDVEKASSQQSPNELQDAPEASQDNASDNEPISDSGPDEAPLLDTSAPQLPVCCAYNVLGNNVLGKLSVLLIHSVNLIENNGPTKQLNKQVPHGSRVELEKHGTGTYVGFRLTGMFGPCEHRICFDNCGYQKSIMGGRFNWISMSLYPAFKARGSVNKAWKLLSLGDGEVHVATIMQQAKPIKITGATTLTELKKSIQLVWEIEPEKQSLCFTQNLRLVHDYGDPDLPLWSLQVVDGSQLTVSMVEQSQLRAESAPDTWFLHNYRSFLIPTPVVRTSQERKWLLAWLLLLSLSSACWGGIMAYFLHKQQEGTLKADPNRPSSLLDVLSVAAVRALLVPLLVLFFETKLATNRAFGGLTYGNPHKYRVLILIFAMVHTVTAISLVRSGPFAVYLFMPRQFVRSLFSCAA